MEAFRAAVEIGVDQIETDVRVTRDGEPLLLHDATVDRATNGTGRVIDMTLSELQALDASNGNDESVYHSNFNFITIDDCTTLEERLKPLL